MRAAFHVDAHKLELRTDVPVPEPDDSEVLIRVKACGFCGSDKHDLETPPRRQQIPGHEFTGVIEQGGDARFPEGSRVIPSPVIICGECPACVAGRDNLCESMTVYGCRGNQPPGGFADYVKVYRRNLFRIPERLSFEEASMVDPVAVALHAIDLGPDPEGLNCAVFGAGVIGLVAAQILAVQGARRVTLFDISRRHLEIAAELGDFETVLVDPSADPYSYRVAEPLDLSLELAGGNAPTIDQALHLSRKGAAILLISQRPGGAHFNYQAALFKEINLQGCCGQSRKDFAEAIEWLGAGKVNVKPIIQDRFPLDEIQSAYEACIRPDALKVVVTPESA